MSASSPGATLMMRVARNRLQREWVRKAIANLFEIEYSDPEQSALWHTKPEWAEKRVSRICEEKSFFGVLTYWAPRKFDGSNIGMRTVAQYYIDAQNKLQLPEDNCVWIIVWMQEGNFEVTELDKAKRVMANFKRLVETLKPTFAAVDNYGENMVKRKGKDPRRFAWGAMYYDAEHVERIGVEKLRSCSALIKQEYPDDAMWIQTWGNPFIVAKELTQQMETELGLKQVFAEPEVPAKVKPKRTK